MPVFGVLKGLFEIAAARGGFAIIFCYVRRIGGFFPFMLGAKVHPSTSLVVLTLLYPRSLRSFISSQSYDLFSIDKPLLRP